MRKNRPPEQGFNIGVRLQREDLAELDEWRVERAIAHDSPPTSRPMAIRHLMSEALRTWRRKRGRP